MAPISSPHNLSSKIKPRFSRQMSIKTCMGLILVALYLVNYRFPEFIITSDGESFSTGRVSRVTSTPSPKADNIYSPKSEKVLSEYAKDVLLAAARERVQKEQLNMPQQQQQPSAENSKRTTTQQNHRISNNNNGDAPQTGLPPLDSLVDTRSNTVKVKDVQWFLDFAVVGFGKCGTTTLLQWLQQSPLVRAPSFEAQYLHNQRPTQLIKKMYQYAIEELEAKETKAIGEHDKILKGFKNPSDIRRAPSRDILTQYFPQTPLIVTVRHPVKWLVSIFNYFKIEKGRHKANVTVADMLAPGGRDEYGDTAHYVSTSKGEFHAMLAEIGKTPLKDSAEWKLLEPWLKPTPSKVADIHQHRLPNPIFFLEMQQLADANTTRAQQFANDLEAFLGLPRNHLPPVLHVRPNTDRVKIQQTDDLKMDICDPQYAPVLQEMMSISRSASQWFRTYFIPSPDITVSSPEYLLELLDEWMVNPCDTDETTTVQQPATN